MKGRRVLFCTLGVVWVTAIDVLNFNSMIKTITYGKRLWAKMVKMVCTFYDIIMGVLK